jgi:hypothetical protein
MSQVILSITADPKLTSFVRQQQQKTTAKKKRTRKRREEEEEEEEEGGRKNRNRNRISPKWARKRYICVTSISQTR